MLSTASHNTKKTDGENAARSERSPGRSGWALQASHLLAGLRFARPPEMLTGIAHAVRPGAVVLAMLLLACLGINLHVKWHPTIPSRFVLRSDTAYSTFRYTSAALNPAENTANSAETEFVAETSVVPPAINALFPEHSDGWKAARKQETVRIPVLPVRQEPSSAGPLLQAGAVQLVRENCYDARLKQRAEMLGETPMMRNWKMLGMQALMASLLTTGPALAQSDGPPSNAEKLTEIQKQLKEMDKAFLELKRSLLALESIGREVASLRTDVTAVRLALSAIDELKVDIARLKSDVEKLRARPAETRLALSPPSDLGIAGTPVGRVEINNTYPTEITVIVNGRSYRVQPGETTLTEPLPAGAFTFQVLGVSELRTRALQANKVYTILVHPLR